MKNLKEWPKPNTAEIDWSKHIEKSQFFGKVILLKNYNVVHDEIITYSKFKSLFIGCIWKYIPDFTFKNRRYLIVDVN